MLPEPHPPLRRLRPPVGDNLARCSPRWRSARTLFRFLRLSCSGAWLSLVLPGLLVGCDADPAALDRGGLLAPARATEQVDPGRELFTSTGCIGCHTAEGAGIAAEPSPSGAPDRRSDLSGLAAKYETDWLKRYLLREEQIGERKHPTRLRTTEAQTDALVTWLLSVPPVAPPKN